MALIECPDCNKMISDAAPACIGCGRPMGSPKVDPSTGQQEAQIYLLEKARFEAQQRIMAEENAKAAAAAAAKAIAEAEASAKVAEATEKTIVKGLDWLASQTFFVRLLIALGVGAALLVIAIITKVQAIRPIAAVVCTLILWANWLKSQAEKHQKDAPDGYSSSSGQKPQPFGIDPEFNGSTQDMGTANEMCLNTQETPNNLGSSIGERLKAQTPQQFCYSDRDYVVFYEGILKMKVCYACHGEPQWTKKCAICQSDCVPVSADLARELANLRFSCNIKTDSEYQEIKKSFDKRERIIYYLVIALGAVFLFGPLILSSIFR